jgi:hypothetical protein
MDHWNSTTKYTQVPSKQSDPDPNPWVASKVSCRYLVPRNHERRGNNCSVLTGGLCGGAGRLLGLRERLVDDAQVVVNVCLLQQVGEGRLRLLAPLLTGVRPAIHNKFTSNH